MRRTVCRVCECHDCVCWVIDRSIRLSPKAQTQAWLEAEHMYNDFMDDGSDWIVYFLSMGWTEDQIYGIISRPQFDDEVLRVVPDGVEYSCNLR